MCGCVQGSKPLYVFSTLLYVPAVDVMVYVNAHVFRFGLLVWGIHGKSVSAVHAGIMSSDHFRLPVKHLNQT